MNARTLSVYIALIALTSVLTTPALAIICPANLGATSTPDSDYGINADETVNQLSTGLMWKRCLEGASGVNCAATPSTDSLWNAALTKSVNSRFAGYDDWRIPNRQELESLVNDTCHSPAINTTIFPGSVGVLTWTSTPYAAQAGRAWMVDFNVGDSCAYVTGCGAGAGAIRLVRGGIGYYDALAPLPCRLDIDGDGTHVAQLDGLLILRHLLGISGASLVGGINSFPASATRTSPQDLKTYMQSLGFDIDGSGGTPAALSGTDGMIILRAMLGFTGAAVTAGLPIP
ncbi:MAG: DUF1566 domain-containing protein, partial [Casimicrobium sp.]